MTNYARGGALFLWLCLTAGIASAADKSVEGEWLVKDKSAHIRILSCSGKMWGYLSWVKQADTDHNNPDPAKRNRPVLGMPILLGMLPAGEGWKGDIYNADNGKTYSGGIRLASPDTLRVTGCFLGRWLCGGEDWTRLPQPEETGDSRAICSRITN